MKSPKTDHLPFVEAGIIWDGVTEYQNVRPPGVGAVFLLRMYGDGTRRFSEFEGTGNPMGRLRALTAQGWEQIGVALVGPFAVHIDGGGFFAYDGTFTLDPVNQFFHLNAFREHAARFAHQLDAAMGHHTLASADERDRLAVWNTMTAMIGSAARRYAEWNEIDPQELIIGGNFDRTPRWRRDLETYMGIDEALCGQCDIATFARRFYLKADLREFARLWRQGILYRADRTTTPWSPTIFDVAQSPHGEFYAELTEFFYTMLEHYDHDIGVQDHT